MGSNKLPFHFNLDEPSINRSWSFVILCISFSQYHIAIWFKIFTLDLNFLSLTKIYYKLVPPTLNAIWLYLQRKESVLVLSNLHKHHTIYHNSQRQRKCTCRAISFKINKTGFQPYAVGLKHLCLYYIFLWQILAWNTSFIHSFIHNCLSEVLNISNLLKCNVKANYAKNFNIPNFY